MLLNNHTQMDFLEVDRLSNCKLYPFYTTYSLLVALGSINPSGVGVGVGVGHSGQWHIKPSLTPGLIGQVQLHFRVGSPISSPYDNGTMNATQITAEKITRIFILTFFVVFQTLDVCLEIKSLQNEKKKLYFLML